MQKIKVTNNINLLLMSDHLLLKWGTIKGYCLENSPKAFEALKEYAKLGMCISRASQEDTPEQKQFICQIIDNVKGPIRNDWTGKRMSKKAAKEYVMNYHK